MGEAKHSDDVNQKEAKRLRHADDYKSRFQRFDLRCVSSWGFAPGFYEGALSALRFAALWLALSTITGCHTAAVQQPIQKSQSTAVYPRRPEVGAPAFRVVHQDEDTYTLVTKEDATDEEIDAILWEFRDAAKGHGFEKLKLSQKFIDARKPTVWFHVYRGAKCASEKYTKGKLPCEASYHGAGDFTLGSYNNPGWSNGVLRHVDGSETQLWDSEAK